MFAVTGRSAAVLAVFAIGATPVAAEPLPAATQVSNSAQPLQAQNQHFRSTMNQLFGHGGWRETSGYRSPALEDQLRREGAGTVPPGALSHHSMGSPDAPGAYDAVVYGMPLTHAATLLRASTSGFSRVLAEGAHGPEGAHLHIEVGSSAISLAIPGPAEVATKADAEAAHEQVCNSIYERVVSGVRNTSLRGC